MYICDVHKSSLRFHYQRFSNNSNPEFTDEEVYHLSVLRVLQRYSNIKEIHTFAKEYLSSWFPKLPSYQTFCVPRNMLSETFKVLVETHDTIIQAQGLQIHYIHCRFYANSDL